LIKKIVRGKVLDEFEVEELYYRNPDPVKGKSSKILNL